MCSVVILVGTVRLTRNELPFLISCWTLSKASLYSSKEIGNGVVIAADGLLYWYSQRGELALVKPESSAFKIVGKTRVSLGSGQHWAHPVINDGKLFVRHGNVLIAYDIR